MKFELVKIYIDDAKLGWALLDKFAEVGYQVNNITESILAEYINNDGAVSIFLEDAPRILYSDIDYAQSKSCAAHRLIDLRGIKTKENAY